MLKYVEHVHNIYYSPKTLKVEFQASADSVLIDVDTARHVELLASSLGGTGGGRNTFRSNSSPAGSLLDIVNNCHTPGGIRQLRAGLFQPPTRLSVIEERLDAVQELIDKPGIFHALQALVSRFCDIDQLLSLCVTIPREETLYTYEKRLNNVIGLRHALELIEPLCIALGCAEAKLLSDIHDTLQDAAYKGIFATVLVMGQKDMTWLTDFCFFCYFFSR